MAPTDNVASKTQTFGYDDLDRLKVASESAGGYNHAYTYNSIGNLTAFNNGATTINYLYGENSKPHAMTSSSETVTPQAVNPSGTPLTATLKENWTGGAISSSKWNNWSSGHASVGSGQLTMTSNISGGYYGVDSEVSGKVYNLTGSSIVNQVVNAGNQSLGSWEVYPIYAYLSGNSSTQYFFYISENTLKAYKKVSGSNTVLATATYSSTNHKWFRIREAGGTTYFDTSANGTSWTNFASTANAFTLTSLVIGAEVGTWSSEGSTTSAVFDNFNYATAPTSELQEDWSGGSINSTRWSDWSGGKATVSSEALNISSTTGGGYYGLDGNGNFNLTGSAIVNQVTNVGNQSLGSWEVYPIYAYVTGDTSNQYFFWIGENTLRAYKRVNGSTNWLASTTYSSTNHKWFRIREDGGTTYFETSPNGSTWNSFASVANPFSVSSMVVGIEAGSWNNEASSTTATFDNFNVLNPTYVYDANGNMTSDGKLCYEFNEANQMKKVKDCFNSQTISEYVYDYNGNRMVKKNYVDGTLHNTVTSWSDAYETKVTGATTENTAYYFVNNEMVGKKDNSGNRTFMHTDHLGSASVVTNSGGTLVEETKYDPWGEVKSGGTASKFLYTGQEKDLETNLNYYNFRYYDSHIRRFTQPDDLIQNPYNPQSLNRYSYVWNNPIKYTDPTGHAVADEVSSAIPYFESITDAIDSGNYWGAADKASNISPFGPEKVVAVGLISKIPGIENLPARVVENGVRYYNNMSTFKRYEGRAGEGMHWGHIVEQTKTNIAQFGKQAIHNTQNVIKMPAKVNMEMNKINSSKPRGSNETVRQAVNKKSYIDQFKYGIQQYGSLMKKLLNK